MNFKAKLQQVLESKKEDDEELLRVDTKDFTPKQKKKREEVMDDLKEREKEFRAKYGENWMKVMQATSSKMVEEIIRKEELVEYKNQPDTAMDDGGFKIDDNALDPKGKMKTKKDINNPMDPYARMASAKTEEVIDEVSNELLGRYKEKARKSADDLSAKGKYKQSTDRWMNITKATGKQIANTTKDIRTAMNKEEKDIDESSLGDYLSSLGMEPKYVGKSDLQKHAQSSKFKTWKMNRMKEDVVNEKVDDKKQTKDMLRGRVKHQIDEPLGKEGDFKSHKIEINNEAYQKLSAHEKFKRSMKKAGYDMDAGAKRLEDMLAKQKKDREEFEKNYPEYASNKKNETMMGKLANSYEPDGDLIENYNRSQMPLKGHEYHSKSDEALRYIMKDAGEAAKAMKNHSPSSESKYLDQVNDAATVLHYRKKHNLLGTVKDKRHTSHNVKEEMTEEQFNEHVSNAAMMVKGIFNKHKKKMSEETYDHEKDDKGGKPTGKQPKLEKNDGKEENAGEKKPSARSILSGGKTETGTPRDTIEIDPMMRNRPGQPDITKKDDKDKKKDDKKDGIKGQEK
jgi:hypothetical protein